jgi:glutamate dehydrogenase
MGAKNTQKPGSLLAEAESVARRSKKPHIQPEVLFSRVSEDDLELMLPESLAAAAILAEAEISAWDGKSARMNLVEADAATSDGRDVSILAITTRNKPFLYDSVMGEVTSQVRDIFIALHPILVVDGKKPATFCSPMAMAVNMNTSRVSHIQIHMPRLSEAASGRPDRARSPCA